MIEVPSNRPLQGSGRPGRRSTAAVLALCTAVGGAAALLFGAGLVAAAGAGAGPAPAAGGVTVRHDIAYTTTTCDGTPQPQKLDAYLPQGGTGPTAAVVWVHGGGFVRGDKQKDGIVAIAEDLARRGWAVFSINYCLPQDGPGFPVEVEDTEAAVRWVAANAGALRVDRSRIATWGGSAGANLALQAAYRLGTTDPTAPVAAAVGWSGPYDFLDRRRWTEQNLATATQYLGCDPRAAACAQTARDASPARVLTPTGTPPTFAASSIDDAVVPVTQLSDLDTALRGAGVDHRSLVVPGDAHSTGLTDAAYCPTVAFLTRYLGPTTGGPCTPPAT